MGLLDLFSSSSEPSSGGGFSLNSLLGTQVPEFLKANLTEDELKALQNQSNLTTGVGGLEGYVSQLYQNKSPLQKILGTYTGAAAGRQSPYTTSQENIFKALKGKELMQNITKTGLETTKLGMENKKLGWETGSIEDLIKNESDPEMQRMIATNPNKYVELKFASDPHFNKDVQPVVSAIGKPINQWDANDWAKYEGYLNRPTQADIEKTLPERAKTSYETGAKFPTQQSREDYLKTLTQISQPAPVPTAAQKEYKYNATPTLPSQPANEVKQGIPLIESSALAPKNKEQLLLDQPKVTDATEYALGTTRDIRNRIRTLLDNPNLKEAFGVGGVLKSYIPNQDAASAAADLETLKNQLFVEGITSMRNASKTGAAIGNVTEKEGTRFENLKASLQQKKKYVDIVAELEKLDKDMETTEKRVNNAYARVYRPAEFTLNPLYERGSYKAPISPSDIPTSGGAGGAWVIKKIGG
jgi:hypothetical protein